MTDTISDMTDYELNEAIAFEVMGWHIDEFGYWMDANDEHTGYIAIEHPDMGWIPTADLNQAVRCVEGFAHITICKFVYGSPLWDVTIENSAYSSGWPVARGACLARAICEAALMAVRAK